MSSKRRRSSTKTWAVPMREWIYESHATSEDNERGIASGHLDPPLSLKGKEQATELGKRYERRPPPVLLCSDLKRSRQTAEIAFPGVPLIQSPQLREWNYGVYNGKGVVEVEALRKRYLQEPFPGGESLEEVAQRVWSFLKKEWGEEVLVIGHRSTFYALEHFCNRRPLEEIVVAPWKWQKGWLYRATSK